jgi:hypothetical protein
MKQYYSETVLAQTAHWAQWFSADWRQEVPTRIHSSDIAVDGGPEWHPDFMKWITRDEHPRGRNNDQRLRTTKVMRRLRRLAVREYEVAFRVLVHGERLEETTRWLNERAQRNGIPFPPYRPAGPHYSEKDTLALFICAIDYARQCW